MNTSDTTMRSASLQPAGRAAVYCTGTLKYTGFGLFTMFFWLLWGDFVWRLMESVLPGILYFLLRELGATDLTIQLLARTLAYGVTASVSPLIAFSSDRHRSRRGRRIPYMLWSTPIVSAVLILIGFYRDISQFLVGHDGTFFGLPLATMYIVVLGVLIVAFDISHLFVSEVYYYLFNDIVPTQFFTRFQAAFSIVGTLATMVYSLCIFPYMLVKDWQWIPGVDNFKTVLVGAGILYAAGFMVMCFMVKEGSYARPKPLAGEGQAGPLELSLQRLGVAFIGRWADGFVVRVKTYARECFTSRFYWYFFLANMGGMMANAIGPFVGLRNKFTLNISYEQIGMIGAATHFVTMIITYPAAWIVDRIHPLRVYVVMFTIAVAYTFVQSVWVFWDFGPQGNYYVLLIIALSFLPFQVVRDLVAVPMSMRLLPKGQYGQFSSANTMFRNFLMIGSTILTGWLMDMLRRNCATPADPEGYWAYRLWPIWSSFWMAVSVFFLFKLYKEWKKRGGDESFVPPTT